MCEFSSPNPAAGHDLQPILHGNRPEFMKYCVVDPNPGTRSPILLGLESPSSIGCIDDVADTDVSAESDRLFSRGDDEHRSSDRSLTGETACEPRFSRKIISGP